MFGAYEFYIKLQFTKTAGIAAIAGTILIFFGIKQVHHKKKQIIMGILMITIGSCFRFNACLLALLVLSSLGMIELSKCVREKNLL